MRGGDSRRPGGEAVRGSSGLQALSGAAATLAFWGTT